MPEDINSQPQFDPGIAQKLDEIIRALDRLSDNQDRHVNDDAAQFSSLQKRLDRLELQLAHLADSAAGDDLAKDVEYDWRAHKAQVLAQYGIDEPVEIPSNRATEKQPVESVTSPATDTDTQVTETMPQKSEIELSDEQANQIELLKKELREKIRQAEVDLSIKHAKLEQQEARIEEKQSELERMSRELESRNLPIDAEQSPGVLGRLKRQLNIIARIRGRAKEPENRNDKFLDALKSTRPADPKTTIPNTSADSSSQPETQSDSASADIQTADRAIGEQKVDDAKETSRTSPATKLATAAVDSEHSSSSDEPACESGQSTSLDKVNPEELTTEGPGAGDSPAEGAAEQDDSSQNEDLPNLDLGDSSDEDSNTSESESATSQSIIAELNALTQMTAGVKTDDETELEPSSAQNKQPVAVKESTRPEAETTQSRRSKRRRKNKRRRK